MSNHGVRPRRRNNPTGLRARILDAAAELFQARGYGSTTTLQVAADAGVTPGALHHHFPTKKALCVAVIRERVAPTVRETWHEPLRAAATTTAAVLTVFEGVCRSLDARGAVRGCPLNNLALELSMADGDFRAELREVFTDWQRALATRLRDDAEAGRTAAADPDALATLIIATYSGAMAMAKVEQQSTPLSIAAKQLTAVLP